MFTVDYDDMARKMAIYSKCMLKNAYDFLEAQTQYFEGKGLIAYPTDADYDAPADSNVVINDEDMCAYIAEKTGLSKKRSVDLSEANLKYLFEIGAVIDMPPSS